MKKYNKPVKMHVYRCVNEPVFICAHSAKLVRGWMAEQGASPRMATALVSLERKPRRKRQEPNP